MLTQDSISEAIREVNVRIGRVQKAWLKLATCISPLREKCHFAALKRAGAVHNGDLPKLLGEAALVPMGSVPAYLDKVCEVDIAEAKGCRQMLQSVFERAGADMAGTIRYVLVGAPRKQVSVEWREQRRASPRRVTM